MVERYGLLDLGSKGHFFNWIGKKEELLVRERIDRALVNIKWIERFPNTHVINLPIIGYNHALILIDSEFRDLNAKKQFNFEVFGLIRRNVVK